MAIIEARLHNQDKVNAYFNRLARVLPPQLKRGMKAAGLVLERSMKKKLSGPPHIGGSGGGNPYPGLRTGRLRASVSSKVSGTFSHFVLKVGPQAHYGVYLELGRSVGRSARSGGQQLLGMYPFVIPTWNDTGEEALDKMVDIALKPVRWK